MTGALPTFDQLGAEQTDKTTELERITREQGGTTDHLAEETAANAEAIENVNVDVFIPFAVRDTGNGGYREMANDSYENIVSVSATLPANAIVMAVGVAQMKARISRWAYAQIDRNGPDAANSVENFLQAGAAADMDAAVTVAWAQTIATAGSYTWRLQCKSSGGNPKGMVFEDGCHIEVVVVGGDAT